MCDDEDRRAQETTSRCKRHNVVVERAATPVPLTRRRTGVNHTDSMRGRKGLSRDDVFCVCVCVLYKRRWGAVCSGHLYRRRRGRVVRDY